MNANQGILKIKWLRFLVNNSFQFVFINEIKKIICQMIPLFSLMTDGHDAVCTPFSLNSVCVSHPVTLSDTHTSQTVAVFPDTLQTNVVIEYFYGGKLECVVSVSVNLCTNTNVNVAVIKTPASH